MRIIPGMEKGMHRPILTYGAPELRRKAAPVETVDDEVRSLARAMLATMKAANGIGLAAEQIGVARAICVVNVPAEHDINDDGERLNPNVTMPLIMINPRIAPRGKRRESEPEGCLSFPGITAAITRPYRITATYTDLQGHLHEVETSDLVARAIQHEVDHLNGVLLVDRMSAVKKVSLAGALKRLKTKTNASR